MGPLGDRLAIAGRQAGLTLAGGVMALIGLGFLGTAGWMMLDRAFGPVIASLATGLLLMGMGCLILTRRTAPPPPTNSQALLAAFLAGLSTGREARN